MSGAQALAAAGLAPVELAAKEGLALTNGTALMAALGALAVVEAENIALVANIAGALSLEALNGTLWAFDPRIHAARPHPRQVEAACCMRGLLEGSTFLRAPGSPRRAGRVYPALHPPGPRRMPRRHQIRALGRGDRVEQRHRQSPDFLGRDGSPVAISGGNFHGEPLAIAFDYLALAITELGNMSERRLARLVDGKSNRQVLPDFLTRDGGLNSGFMLTQYTAAALASENKSLVHPASADTIPTSANWEDHVSNGPIAGRKARQIIENVERIIATRTAGGRARDRFPAGGVARGPSRHRHADSLRLGAVARAFPGSRCGALPAHERHLRVGGGR